MSLSAEDRRIRSLRPRKNAVEAEEPLGVLVEEERRPGGAVESALTVFLAGSECPFTCVFCDLWRNTLDRPTPAGALPAQLRAALARAPVSGAARRVKLYNASNFFDPRAVPPEDLDELALLAAPFEGVTVESHPRLVGARCLDFAGRIEGRLEVAMGLETVHPAALPRLNKKMSLADFDRAAEYLGTHDLELRVFALLGTPFVPRGESVAWMVRTVEHALARGAALVAIVPVRGGNGELERLRELGQFDPPTLGELETALEECRALGPGVVVADLWDVDRLSGACESCRTPRVERLARMNATGRPEPVVSCGECRTA